MPLFCVIFVELLEKFDGVIKSETEAEVNVENAVTDNTNRVSLFSKYKLRLAVGIWFTFTWVLARLLTLAVKNSNMVLRCCQNVDFRNVEKCRLQKCRLQKC
jgi:hypothetical protein